LELVFRSKKLEEQCTSVKAATKMFGGDKGLVIQLQSRIQALREAETLKDIVVQSQFHFHKLTNKHGRNLEGLFAIDVKSRKSPWRLIMQPLDNDKEPFDPCNIDVIAGIVEIVGIVEVSKHYE